MQDNGEGAIKYPDELCGSASTTWSGNRSDESGLTRAAALRHMFHDRLMRAYLRGRDREREAIGYH
jgi:hypothetical protein